MSKDIVAKVEYRFIPKFPGYRVGDDASVWSTRGSRGKEWRRLKTPVIGPGYKGLSMYDVDGKQHIVLLHKIVALAFLGDPPGPEYEVRHWDGDPMNCLPSNLKWRTRKDNMADAVRHGTTTSGSRNRHAQLDEGQVRAIRRRLSEGERVGVLAKEYGVASQTISAIKTCCSWNHL